jgi:hypothetical protein
VDLKEIPVRISQRAAAVSFKAIGFSQPALELVGISSIRKKRLN